MHWLNEDFSVAARRRFDRSTLRSLLQFACSSFVLVAQILHLGVRHIRLIYRNEAWRFVTYRGAMTRGIAAASCPRKETFRCIHPSFYCPSSLPV